MIFGRFGPVELILILAIALLIFGPKKVPEIGKAIGKAIREFKNGSKKEEDDQVDEQLTTEERKQLNDESVSVDSVGSKKRKKEKASS